MAKYVKICAWCGREISREEIPGDEDIISHGICEECAEKMRAEMRERMGVLSDDDILHQAESFLSYWGRVGGEFDRVFEYWASTKDFLAGDKERILSLAKSLRPDVERLLASLKQKGGGHVGRTEG